MNMLRSRSLGFAPGLTTRIILLHNRVVQTAKDIIGMSWLEARRVMQDRGLTWWVAEMDGKSFLRPNYFPPGTVTVVVDEEKVTRAS